MIEWESTTDWHVYIVLERLRGRDAELRERPDVVLAAVRESLHAQTAFYNGMVAGMYGVRSSFGAPHGYLWMLGTDLIDEHPIAFLRASQDVIVRLREQYLSLYGLVWNDYSESCRWLEWLGAKLTPHTKDTTRWALNLR